ncbi:MAG: hypothetical protein QM758_29740 [Armatimonas sp.]
MEQPASCPNCGKPLMYKAIRCMECGHRLVPPPVAFDLSEDPPETAPTWSKSALLDRWVGALTPFAVSLVWLGAVQLAPEESRAVLSIYAAPLLRFILPLVASRAWKDRYPWLATGFKNALWAGVAFALALGTLLVIAIPLWFLGAFLTACSEWNSPHRSFETGVRLTPALLASTLVAQGLLAGFLPPAAVITRQGIRLPKQIRIGETLVGTLLVLFLAARWVLPADFKDGQSIAAGGAALLLILLGCIRALRSEHLKTPHRIIVIALVLMVGGLMFWAVR